MVELDQLRKLSARVGADPLLVQAAGGNTSLKDEGIMWIKASGTWLKDAGDRDIFVPLAHAAILAGLEKNDPACENCVAFVRTDLNATGLRPSIETTVHALMPQRVVVHVHCVNTIAWAIRADGEARLAEKLRISTGPIFLTPVRAFRWPVRSRHACGLVSTSWCSATTDSSWQQTPLRNAKLCWTAWCRPSGGLSVQRPRLIMRHWRVFAQERIIVLPPMRKHTHSPPTGWR